MRTTIAVFLALLVAAGCKDKETKTPAPAAADDAAPQAAATIDAAPKPPVMGHGDWDALVKVPDDAELLTPLKVHGMGEKMTAAYCLKARNAKKAAEVLRKLFEANEWTALHVVANTPDRAAVTGERIPYRIAATIRNAELANCKASEKKTFVAIVVERLGPGARTAPAN